MRSMSAYNGEEALEKFSQEPPDLVILDINMPGMNGIEVLRRMKEMNPEPAGYPQFRLPGV